MRADADALPFAPEWADELQWRRAVARPMPPHQFDRCEIGRDAHLLINPKTGIGSIVIASAWLALLVITLVHH